jgi:hypothetical protein
VKPEKLLSQQIRKKAPQESFIETFEGFWLFFQFARCFSAVVILVLKHYFITLQVYRRVNPPNLGDSEYDWLKKCEFPLGSV